MQRRQMSESLLVYLVFALSGGLYGRISADQKQGLSEEIVHLFGDDRCFYDWRNHREYLDS